MSMVLGDVLFKKKLKYLPNPISSSFFIFPDFQSFCFSFVKNSSKYYDDSAKILGNMILRELSPQLQIPWNMPYQLDDPPIVPTTVGKMMELR